MMVCTSISTCSRNMIFLIGNVQKQMSNRVCNALSLSPSSSCCCYSFVRHSNVHYSAVHTSRSSFNSFVKGFQEFPRISIGFGMGKPKAASMSLMFKSTIGPRCYRKTRVNVSTESHNMDVRLLGPKQRITSKIKCDMRPFSWKHRGVSVGLFIGLLACSCTSEPSYAEAPEEHQKKECDSDASSAHLLHGKKVLTGYSVIGIPGDGRCLFRSVAHGACIRSGKPAPSEKLQRELADELRARVADEFVKRREETEWFIEGDFEAYVSQIRKPHVWGGEPELLMASHVLQMPITVYMHDEESGGLISIAEYGQEYSKDNPIKVLYHGFGHYDALHIPQDRGARPRL